MASCVLDRTADGLTILDVLRWRALHEPDFLGYTFLTDGEEAEVSLTYRELDRRAKSISAMIRSIGAQGQPILIALPSCLEFIATFFGCLYSGSIAVPIYPPRPNRSVERFAVIARDSGATVVLTLESVRSRIEADISEVDGLEDLTWVTVDRAYEATEATPEDWARPDPHIKQLALLQYTSGSTAKPKGAMVSHDNIMHNSHVLSEIHRFSSASVGVGWLPMTHDMGLIANTIQPLYSGFRYIFMAPEHFLVKPIRWLGAIFRYKATASGGPNFSYDYCSERIRPELRDELDLSSWDLAFNGAEPIRHETIERFSAEFSRCGFRREAFYPCYGLAESTLIVTGGSRRSPPVEININSDQPGLESACRPGKNADSNRVLVGCGEPWLGQQVLIVDPETSQRCPDGHVGEIWISGPSVTQGYWNRRAETERVFGGYLQDTGDGPFLRSGDLGFLYDGNLFVSGRLKDLIIVGGTNHFPVDIEMTVEKSHKAIRKNCVAAISTNLEGIERLVIVAEIDRHFAAKRMNHCDEIGDESSLGREGILTAIREAVSQNHELRPHDICLVKQSTIPRTSSAKIQRHVCRQQYLAGELSLV